ncbi:mechanosensitive ion channel family protein [Thermococcus sp.]|uniref:mechanosensitive ion channel family protein n=1 Tax=Thermococcus sp. TaxID=35749 RepID=UPI0026392C43|nr:mechanosensitive ion channel family protein [Thermococcus sp.]
MIDINASGNVTIGFGPTNVTMSVGNIITAIAVFIVGFLIAKVVKHYILTLSKSTKYVWVLNEDTARTFYNMIVIISAFYALHVLGVLSYKVSGTSLSDIFTALTVFYFSYLLAKKSKDYMVMRAPKEKLNEMQVKAKLFYYTVVTIAFFLALNIAGLSGRLSTIMAAAGITGVVLGIASQAVVANFLAGIAMYFDKPLRIGDAVRIGNVEGIVHDIRILSTRIRAWDGTLVRVPNEKLFNSEIVNLQKYPARRAELTLGIAYREDAQRAIDIIMKVLDEEPYVLAVPEPRAYVEELGDSAVNIRVWAWVPSSLWRGQNLLRAEYGLLQKIRDALKREGIEIPFPQRVNWFAEPLRIKFTDDEQES